MNKLYILHLIKETLGAINEKNELKAVLLLGKIAEEIAGKEMIQAQSGGKQS